MAEAGRKQLEQLLQMNLFQQAHLLSSQEGSASSKGPGSMEQLRLQQQQLMEQLQTLQQQSRQQDHSVSLQIIVGCHL